MVRDRKDVLFGKFDNSKNISKESKKLAWQNIKSQLEAMDISLVPNGKDWTYLRGVIWRNLIASAKKRYDAKKKNGEWQNGLNATGTEIFP